MPKKYYYDILDICFKNKTRFERVLFWENLMGRLQSGQMHETVNLAAYAFASSNLARPTVRLKSPEMAIFVII